MVNPKFAAQKLGNGPILIELWLDYICPFSKKQFDAIYKSIQPEVEKKFPNKFSFVFQFQPQPWHGQGSYLHEAGIAVTQLDPSKFWEFSYELFAVSENFYDVNTWDKSRKQIAEELSDVAAKVGVDKKKFLDLISIDLSGPAKNPGPAVVNDVKYFVKLGRQNGIHVSPTVVINDLIDGEISSSWTAEQWIKKLDSVLKTSEISL